MSVQSEITRLSGNVADALDAIEAKGVNVPVGATSDNLASLIQSIEQLPDVTSDDNGKMLRVVDGEWAVVDSPSATISDMVLYINM